MISQPGTELASRFDQFRIGVWVSHPIQYLTPWFVHLARRHQVEVFYAHRESAEGQARAGFGVKFLWDRPLLAGYQSRFLKNVASQPRLDRFGGSDTPEIAEVVRRGAFDAFVVFGWNRKGALQTVRACRQYRVPVLMRGDSQLRTSRTLGWRLAKYPLYRWFLAEMCDGHLCVGSRNREYLRHYGVAQRKLFCVPHVVDNEYFALESKSATVSGRALAFRQALGIPDDAFVFLFVGKLIEKKRPGDFVAACRSIIRSTENQGVHAVLVGDGPLRASLERLAFSDRARIHFAGFRNQTELPTIYAAANAIVLPSDASETWGLVVNEAAACGLPAIVSDAVGCGPDMIEEGRTGYVFPVGDVELLANRMLALKSDCEQRLVIVQEQLRRVVASHSVERAAIGLEDAVRVLNPTVSYVSRQRGRESA